MALILKKGLFLTNFSHFLVTREKIEKFLQHMSYLHKNTYLAHHFYFFALPILQKKKKIRIYLIWFLFGTPPGVDS